MDEEQEPQAEQSSPWPALTFAFLGAGLAVAGMSVEGPTVEFLACGCLLFSWYLARTSGDDAAGDEAADDETLIVETAPKKPAPNHPMANRSTQLLLLLFALLTGVIGALRVMRGG